MPKAIRDELGLDPGTELDLRTVDGHLELVVPSRVAVENGPHGVRFTAAGGQTLNAADIRAVLEGGRR